MPKRRTKLRSRILNPRMPPFADAKMSSISSSQPIHIEILGQSFTLKTDDSPEYIQSLVDDLKQRYARISARMNVADPLRVAILDGLFLLEDVKKMQNQPLSAKSGRTAAAALPSEAPRTRIPMRSTSSRWTKGLESFGSEDRILLYI